MTKITRYATPAAFRMGREERPRQAAPSVTWLTRQRRLMAFDRLLARLLAAAPERWILKGAVALDYRLGDRARATMDLDLAHKADAEEATLDLLTAQSLDLDDFLAFEVSRLRHAIDGTFVPRGLQTIPSALPLPPDRWEAPYSRLAGEGGLHTDVAVGHGAAAAFLDPIPTNAVSPAARWDTATRAWDEPDDSPSSG